MANTDRKIKVAVLGGGVGAMTAATFLTSTPELRAKYQVTVYQQGWRLGGKGASGRNSAHANRIEEHGLHVWMGWYQNAFAMIRNLYDEWEPPKGSQFSDWTDAFDPCNVITFMNQDPSSQQWSGWTVNFPENPETPGDGKIMDSSWDYLVMMIEFLRHTSRQTDCAFDTEADDKHEGLIARLIEDTKHLFGFNQHKKEEGVHTSLTKAATIASKLPRDVREHLPHHHHGLIGLLEELRDWVEAQTEKSAKLTQFLALASLVLAVFRGLISAGFPHFREFPELWDDIEFRSWLKEHGANQHALDSGVLRSFYELGFCYVDGDRNKPAVAAGSALRCMMRMCGGYKGAVLWHMQAGMGDTIFTPIYEVLTRRGVAFKFFQRIDQLHLDDSGRKVQSISVTSQCRIKGEQKYSPLISIRGVGCWPSEPFWDQIEHGSELRGKGVNFESYWSENPAEESYSIECGKDFDQIIFGISLGSIPIVASELVHKSDRWQKACDKVKTVQTQAAQLWLSPTRRGLGWEGPVTVLTSYSPPMATWADMTYLVDRESWPEDERPGSLAYLCGVMAGPEHIPGPEQHDFPKQQYDSVRSDTREWIERHASLLWPGTFTKGHFDDDLLVATPKVSLEHRYDAQYFRANIDPSERYVLTVPGSTKYRLTSSDPEFDNIVLAGDWTAGCINGGCVEGAVVGGMQAARALCGTPDKIQGE